MTIAGNNKIITELARLTDKEFVEVFYAAVKNRELVLDVEKDYFERHWAIADVSRLKEENGSWEPYEIEFLGLENSDKYGTEAGVPTL